MCILLVVYLGINVNSSKYSILFIKLEEWFYIDDKINETKLVSLIHFRNTLKYVKYYTRPNCIFKASLPIIIIKENYVGIYNS